MSTFIRSRLDELPPHIAGPEGEAFATALGQAQDDELPLLRAAAVADIPHLCPDDALDGAGEWVQIERFDDESHDAYRERLEIAMPTWRKAGSPQAIIDSLHAYGIADVQVVQDYQATLGLGSWFSRFVVVIGPDFGTLTPTPTPQGSPTTQGSPTLQGASGVTVAQIKAVRKQILKWKSAHSYPCDVVLLFTASPFVGAGAVPGSYVNDDGDDLVHWPIGHLLPVEAPTEALPYQV